MNNENIDNDRGVGRQASLRGLGDSDEGEGMSVGELIGALREYKWMAISITAVSIIAGGVWAYISEPTYKATGLVQVEEKATLGLSALKDFDPLSGGGDTTVAAEQELLASRMVLGRVIDRLKLNIVAEPKYFPMVGRAVYRRFEGIESGQIADPLLGLSNYAWGGEDIRVDSFDVPKNAHDVFHELVVLGEKKYQIFNDQGEVVVSGKVGERVQSKGYSLFISEINARTGSSFKLMKLSIDEAMKSITKRYQIRERGKKSGIIEVTLQGADADRLGVVLDDILNAYVRQNVERRSQEAENTLKFLEGHLPVVKKQLDSAEAAYNGYRQSRGSLDLSLETQSLLTSIVDVENQALALKQERDELRQYFTSEHPRVQAVDSKLEKLNARRKNFDGDISRLPDTQQTVLRLARDVEVNTALYTNLVNTSQQLRVAKAGTIGDVRVIDSAIVSSTPIGIGAGAILALSGIVGLLLSSFVAWLITRLRVTVDNPDELEERLGLPVYATVPHSDVENSSLKSKTGQSDNLSILAVSSPDDDAVEALRSLRTVLHFALLDAKQNSILITGPSPGAGKSFVSKNLGAVIGQTGKRVVIVDADLRRGHLNKDFGLRRDVGISEYVGATGCSLDEIIKPTSVPNVWVVTTGVIPPNPSELLMHLRFSELLEKLSEKFDTMIVDAPPILAVSDAAIIARSVGATLLVLRSDCHPMKEIELSVKRMHQAGINVKGFVFNDLDINRQRYRYGYKGYVYKYSYK